AALRAHLRARLGHRLLDGLQAGWRHARLLHELRVRQAVLEAPGAVRARRARGRRGARDRRPRRRRGGDAADADARHPRLADRGGNAGRSHHLGSPAGASALQGAARVRVGAHREHVHGEHPRRADGARLRAVLRGYPEDTVRDLDARDRGGVCGGFVRGAQQHDRHLVHGDLRPRRLRVQETRLPARARRPGARPRRPLLERAPSEPHHVPGLTRDLRDAPDRGGDHRGGAPVLLASGADALVAPAARRRRPGAGRVMTVLADLEFWIRLLGISLLNLVLSGDNALVIALAVRALPRRKRVLGQIWGAAGAVALRLVFVGLVSLLLKVPLLQLVGGLLLAWIAARLMRPEGEGAGEVRHGTSLREAIWIIIIADVTMSLDNVLAIAAAAHGDLLLVMFGVGLSLPIVVWGAGLLAHLMNRYAWIVWLGGGLLGYVAGEMFMEDPIVRRGLGEVAGPLHYPVPLVVGLVVTACGWWFARAHRHRVRVPENL